MCGREGTGGQRTTAAKNQSDPGEQQLLGRSLDDGRGIARMGIRGPSLRTKVEIGRYLNARRRGSLSATTPLQEENQHRPGDHHQAVKTRGRPRPTDSREWHAAGCRRDLGPTAMQKPTPQASGMPLWVACAA